ncbi:hypothetical protein [Ktedonobacter racemifer]|uniref:hypothetical protein n=1 Tax=Ktedonobacter racemifer TaxID=363277 RepID=UPI001B7F8E5C|nr:hypothetical protein [Ktedonobacter racemifer]
MHAHICYGKLEQNTTNHTPIEPDPHPGNTVIAEACEAAFDEILRILQGPYSYAPAQPFSKVNTILSNKCKKLRSMTHLKNLQGRSIT